MSYTYIANGGEEFLTNSAGSELLGLIHRAAGARYVEYHGQPQHPFSGSAAEAAQDARTIRAHRDRLEAVYDAQPLFSGTYAQFLEFVEEWCCWLEHSGGYEVQ